MKTENEKIENPPPTRIPRSIHVLNAALGVAWVLLTMAIVVFALVALAAGGDGSVTLDGTTRAVNIAPVEDADAVDYRFGSTDVRVEIHDRPTRAVAIATLGGLLALAWIAVANLRRMVAETAQGRPFTEANVRRLQRVGWVCLAFPVVTTISREVLTEMIEGDLAVSVEDLGPSLGTWWAWLIAGLLLVSIARVFAYGIELLELDQTTI